MTITLSYSNLKLEDGATGGLGFVGLPIIQSAGKERALTREPREMFESGDYATDVRVLMGANKHEGLFCTDYIYQLFIRPNNLTNNTDYLSNDFVPMILKALGNFLNICKQELNFQAAIVNWIRSRRFFWSFERYND